MKPVIEEWRPISEFSDYEVSNLGSVRRRTPGLRTQPGRIRKLSASTSGHLYTSFHTKGKSQRRFVHALVCTEFNGARPSPKHEVAHNDGVPANNWPSNLRWATRKENIADIFRHGTRQNTAGERSAMAKLSEAEVREIFARASRGELHRSIARDFGVTRSCVGAIWCGTNWSHLGLRGMSAVESAGVVQMRDAAE